MTASPCGTHSAYVRHIQLGERPDMACCRANTDYKRSLRLLRGARHSVQVPAWLLGMLLSGDPDALRQAVAELGQRTVDAAKEISARTNTEMPKRIPDGEAA